MPFNIGPLEIAIVLVIVLLIVGPKRLPQMGRSLGSSLREFKNGITGKGHKDDEDEPEAIAAAKTEDVETRVP